jgi:hypothetical protein
MQSLETLTLDPEHPWVAEALAQTADPTAPTYDDRGRPWENYEAGTGSWNGERGWANGDHEVDEDRDRAEERAAGPAWPEREDAPAAPRADSEPEGWEDAYMGQAARWSLAAAEADLHGPDEPDAAPGQTGAAPAAEAAPPGNGHGYTGNGAADDFAPWPPAPPADPEPVAAEYDDEDRNEPVH